MRFSVVQVKSRVTFTTVGIMTGAHCAIFGTNLQSVQCLGRVSKCTTLALCTAGRQIEIAVFNGHCRGLMGCGGEVLGCTLHIA